MTVIPYVSNALANILHTITANSKLTCVALRVAFPIMLLLVGKILLDKERPRHLEL